MLIKGKVLKALFIMSCIILVVTSCVSNPDPDAYLPAEPVRRTAPGGTDYPNVGNPSQNVINDLFL